MLEKESKFSKSEVGGTPEDEQKKDTETMETESFTSSEEEVSGKEKDTEFAHMVANHINKLVNKGVISRENISNASAEAMDEFISRFRPSFIAGKFTPKAKKKIKTLFSSREALSEKIETGPVRKEIILMMREMISKLEDRYEDLVGFVICGSRMDPEKQPRDTVKEGEGSEDEASDIDVIPITSRARLAGRRTIRELRNTISSRGVSLLNGDIDALQKEFYPESADIPINISKVHDTFRTELEEGYFFDRVPYWAWKPDAVYFVGSLPEEDKSYGMISSKDPFMSEEEVNRLLQECLRSEKTKMKKIEILERIRRETKTGKKEKGFID